jgi:hypothetical protein
MDERINGRCKWTLMECETECTKGCETRERLIKRVIELHIAEAAEHIDQLAGDARNEVLNRIQATIDHLR